MDHCIEQLIDLMYDPQTAAGRGYYVKLRVFRADTPARHYAKGTTHHSGYASCERCLVVGVQSNTVLPSGVPGGRRNALKSTVVFPEKAAPRKMRDWNSYKAPTGRTVVRRTAAARTLRRRLAGARAPPKVRENTRKPNTFMCQPRIIKQMGYYCGIQCVKPASGFVIDSSPRFIYYSDDYVQFRMVLVSCAVYHHDTSFLLLAIPCAGK